jgi:hypothetical protein
MPPSFGEISPAARGTERLPYELWRYILRLVTNATPTASTPWPLPPDSPILHSVLPWLAYEDDHESALKTKSAIALVSRCWRNYTIDFLLEDVAIRTSDRLCRFVEQLERNQLLQINHTRLHPFHVKRVLSLSAQNGLDEYEALIQVICNLCINMKALSLPFLQNNDQRSIGSDLEPALSSRCRSLRFLELGGCDVTWKVILNVVNLTNLEILSLSFQRADDSNFDTEPAGVSLPRLHTLHISRLRGENGASWITSWNLPSLTSFRVETSACSYLREAGFFDVHGQKLTTVMLGKWMDPGVPEVLRCCNSLRRLRLDLPLSVGITPFHPKHLAANEITFLILMRQSRQFTRYHLLGSQSGRGPTLLALRRCRHRQVERRKQYLRRFRQDRALRCQFPIQS